MAHTYIEAEARADAAADASSAAHAAGVQSDQCQRATARAQSAIADRVRGAAFVREDRVR